MISEKHILRIYQYELMAFAFMLPIYRKVIPYLIATILITWLLEGDFIAKAKRLAHSVHRLNTLLFAGIYLFYFLGLAYTNNFSNGLFDLEVKMSLFIFPVVLASIREDVLSIKIARKILFSFVYGVAASMFLCYAFAIYNYIQEGSIEVFYYSRLSFLIHPSYLSMYACFAIAVLLYFSWKKVIRGKRMQMLAMFAVLAFEFFVILLSSKAGILSLLLIIGMYISYLVFSQKRIAKAFISGGLLIASFVFLFLLFPSSATRFAETREAIGQADIHADEIANSSSERIMIWWYVFEITNDNLLGGVGTGDVKDHLLAKYSEKQMMNALQLELNAHNQYLQTLIALGLFGLVVLLLNLILPALYSIEFKHYLYLIFILLIAFNFLFESMLETQAGVVFYAFFNAYLFAIKKDPASIEAGS